MRKEMNVFRWKHSKIDPITKERFEIEMALDTMNGWIKQWRFYRLRNKIVFFVSS